MFRLGSNTNHTRNVRRQGLAVVTAGALVTSGLGVTVLAAPALAAPAQSPVNQSPVNQPSGNQPSADQASAPIRLDSVGAGLRSTEVRLADAPAARRAAGGGPSLVASLRTDGFTMVGVTWPGSGDPDLRVRVRADGRWGAWQDLPTLTDGPTRGTAEGRTASRGATGLLWAGEQRRVQVKAGGALPPGAEVVLTDTSRVKRSPAQDAKRSSGQGAELARTVAQPAAAKPAATTTAKASRVPRPLIRSRSVWGANEKWRDGTSTRVKRIRQVHVHHTVNGNDYERGDVPGILRGIYRYHTKSLGWSDIGYNVLVDRFGRAWAGRRGVARRTQGAHTLGFNHNSAGIAVIGNFETATPSKAVRVRIARVAAWLLDRDGSRATGRVRRISHASDKYPYGRRVWLPVIDGHRDTNDTACPGHHLYAALPDIRRRAQNRIDRY